MIGLFVGKFQPFHNGHLETIRHILKECDLVKIVIGSSQYHDTENNPFTLEEREKMINLALEEAKIIQFELHGIKDLHNLPLWADSLLKSFQPFDTAYSRNKQVTSILREKGVEVREQPMFGDYNGTEIRRLISSGESWESLVPPAVFSYLNTLNLEERFRSIEPPTHTC